jgi:hypothetical protein
MLTMMYVPSNFHVMAVERFLGLRVPDCSLLFRGMVVALDWRESV